jgi:hypothetical protein
MCKWLSILLFYVPLSLFAQKKEELKKKYLGVYEGIIPSYKMDTGEDVVDVQETSIRISIQTDSVYMLIGYLELKGSYEVMFKADNYYLLDVKMDNQEAAERIIVYKRGKHISRDGLFPQPVTELSKK